MLVISYLCGYVVGYWLVEGVVYWVVVVFELVFYLLVVL